MVIFLSTGYIGIDLGDCHSACPLHQVRGNSYTITNFLSITVSSRTNYPLRFSIYGSTSSHNVSGVKDYLVRNRLNASWEKTIQFDE